MCPSGATCWSVVFFGYSNKTDRHDIAEILLKVMLNPIAHYTHGPFPINSDLLNTRPYMMKLLIFVPQWAMSCRLKMIWFNTCSYSVMCLSYTPIHFLYIDVKYPYLYSDVFKTYNNTMMYLLPVPMHFFVHWC